MAFYPDKTTVKTELQENVTKCDLSSVHLTTSNFFELGIAYYRENTPREKWTCATGVFARPVPMQAPVMGEATLSVKNYYVPYRILSPQWNDFITRTPHTPYNGNTPFIVQEMPYITAKHMVNFITDTEVATKITTGTPDFTTLGGNYKLTQFGRHCAKILNQLGYQLIVDSRVSEHFDAMPILAFAKIYLDYYTSNQYATTIQDAYEVEALLKKDEQQAYELTDKDLMKIFKLTQYVNYSPDYFVSQWDNPTSPNTLPTSYGQIYIKDITNTEVENGALSQYNKMSATPYLDPQNGLITQYALDALKGLTDYVKRMQLSAKAIDRYLARFGVILTNEKMTRSVYNGEQNTTMNFGAIYSTAETADAALGDYAGQGNINSAGQGHNLFEFEQLDEFGCIMSLFSINPKIGYYQGIDRQHLVRDPESYFNGQWDSLGTQATSCAELYVSLDANSIYSQQQQFNAIFGYLPRQAHHKVGKDRLTGDFVRKSINRGADAWHMFRIIDESIYESTTNNMKHSPAFISTKIDADQYNRIFNYQSADGGDMFNIIFSFNINANIHAKALYDDYDFEGEGKKIIMAGQGPSKN